VNHYDHDDLTEVGYLSAAENPAGHRGIKVDRPRIEAAVREILLAIGEDTDREGLRETPARGL